ncbi:MAG: glycosyltransferase, partial [Proteobacteria bacterium]|nr:glycosyltransferase [Pseudomonadota bacterium]
MHEDPFRIDELPSRAPLRVAVVTETYPPEINGVAMTIGRMVDGLLRRNHRIQLIRPRQHEGEAPAQDAAFEEMLARGLPIPNYGELKLGLPAKQRLARLWSLRRPDLVHIVTEGPQRLPHQFPQLQPPLRPGLAASADQRLSAPVSQQDRCDAGADGDVAARSRRARLPQSAGGRTRRGRDPVPACAALRASWHAGPRDPVAIYVGRIAPEKNLPLLFQAVAAIQEVRPGAKLVMVGDGPARRALERDWPQHIFAGMRTGEDLAAHYASADLFLFPSLTETFGNVTAEALASGLAVVAYDYAAAGQLV